MVLTLGVMTNFGSLNIIPVHPKDHTETIAILAGYPEGDYHQAHNNGYINK